jgi:hypothetical protein
MNLSSIRRHGTCLLHGATRPISDTDHRAGAHWRSHAPDSDPEQLSPGQKYLSGLAVGQNLCFSILALSTLFPPPLFIGPRKELADIGPAP